MTELGQRLPDVEKRSIIKVGDIVIGAVDKVPLPGGHYDYRAYRVHPEGYVQVGVTSNQRGAMSMIARSLIAKSIDDGAIPPAKRAQFQEALGVLRDAGLGNVADFIASSLR